MVTQQAPARPPTTRAELEAATSDYDVCGWIFSCTLEGVAVKHPDLLERLSSFGLSAFAPKEPTPRIALTRALKALLRADATADGFAQVGGDLTAARSEKRMVPAPINDGDWLVFNIVLQKADMADLGMDFDTQLRVKLGKKSGSLLCTRTRRGQIVAENEDLSFARKLQPFWQYFREFHGNSDVSRVVYDAVRSCASVSVRRDGGLHFVPSGEQEMLFNIVSFVNSLNGARPLLPTGLGVAAVAYAIAPGIPDRAEQKTGLAAAALDGLTLELRGFALDLADLTRQKPGALDPATVGARVRSYRATQERISTYADVLGMQDAKLRADLARLRAAAIQLQDLAQMARATGGGLGASFAEVQATAGTLTVALGGRPRSARALDVRDDDEADDPAPRGARELDLDSDLAPELTRAAR